MKTSTNIINKMLAIVALLAMTASLNAAEVVYRILEYNSKTGEFMLAASGDVPQDSWVIFENDYGATTGNRYNQIPRGRKATLYLEGWQGCTLKSVTFSMCSNNKSGQAGFSINDGKPPLYTMKPSDFSSKEWFGDWVSKDFGTYVDIKKTFTVPAFSTDEGSIELKGGTSEGSVYINAITIEYEHDANTKLQSPLGWIYEKLTPKSKIEDGDELMIFRNGSAAADLGGMKESHYLDVVSVTSTTDVTDPFVLRFTANKTENNNQWTLTDQDGRLLGATTKQTLAWNDGATKWDISLDYDGAVIANENDKYGTLRYNTPTESYARFALYTSKTLPLPFLYRKVSQRQPELSSSITFEQTEIAESLDARHIALRPTIMPTSTTDKRIAGSSSNENVATVNGGFITLLSTGETTITATTLDSKVSASVHLTVTEPTGINTPNANNTKHNEVRKTLKNGKVIIVKDNTILDVDGKIIHIQ